MICRLFAQQHKGQQLGSELNALLSSGSYTQFTVVVAFLRSEGVEELKERLQEFITTGVAKFIVGISGKVTSYEGLKLLRDVLREDSVSVFHNANSSAGIFHPKLYLLEGKNKAVAVIASNNLTRPGLFLNYELAIAIELNLAKNEDQQLLIDLKDYIRSLLANSELAKKLTSEFLEKLKDSGRSRSRRKNPSPKKKQKKRLRRNSKGPHVRRR